MSGYNDFFNDVQPLMIFLYTLLTFFLVLIAGWTLISSNKSVKKSINASAILKWKYDLLNAYSEFIAAIANVDTRVIGPNFFSGPIVAQIKKIEILLRDIDFENINVVRYLCIAVSIKSGLNQQKLNDFFQIDSTQLINGTLPELEKQLFGEVSSALESVKLK